MKVVPQEEKTLKQRSLWFQDVCVLMEESGVRPAPRPQISQVNTREQQPSGSLPAAQFSYCWL